jgi:hypothetical protein
MIQGCNINYLHWKKYTSWLEDVVVFGTAEQDQNCYKDKLHAK